MRVFILILLLGIGAKEKTPEGAWEYSQENVRSVLILSDGFLTVSSFEKSTFIETWGGKYSIKNNTLTVNLEYNSGDPAKVGTYLSFPFNAEKDILNFDQKKWKMIDNGSPGDLQGAWIITGRERDGEMISREPGSRKTMKVLSGTRFQWIAYDIDSKKFMGTGGGTYTSVDGTYTENIDFFSRDNSRVGASLEFEYELKNKNWHHKGHSSKGDPIYEVWSIRKD